MNDQSRPALPRRQRRKAREKAAAASAAASIVVPPPVPMARLKRRHHLIGASFVVVVVLPTLLAAWYLLARAEPQFMSQTAFSVQSESRSALDGLDSGYRDTDVLFSYLFSSDLVARLDAELDLRGHYAALHDRDPVFALAPGASLEALTAHWRRVTEIIYEPTRGIIGLNVRAFDPAFAPAVVEQVLREATRVLNEMVDVAQQDATQFTATELAAAEDRLRDAREQFTAFRSQARIVDPVSDLAGQMSLMQTMQAELADLLIDRDMLAPLVESTDPRIAQIDRQIAAVRARIDDERSRFGRGGEARSGAQNYAALLEEYERLDLERGFAEDSYTSARAAHDAALAEALLQNRYIAPHILPSVPEQADFPHVLSLVGQVLLLLLMGWTMVVLIYYAARDSR